MIPAHTDTELTVKGDADLVAENIRKAINIFGVVGTLEEGVTGVDYGEVTIPTGSYLTTITVNHNLGVVPTMFAILRADKDIAFTVGAVFNAGEGKARSFTASKISSFTSARTTTTFTVDSEKSGSNAFTPGLYRWVALA